MAEKVVAAHQHKAAQDGPDENRRPGLAEVVHDGYENPWREGSDNAGGGVHGLRAVSAKLKRPVAGENVVEAQQRHHRQE